MPAGRAPAEAPCPLALTAPTATPTLDSLMRTRAFYYLRPA